ncbi:MAG TPA: CotH kinase family protein, partial [Candidatus Saccharimonadales bacterium]|nr:CotH kinase family protein [Candidatus Saccharimonadales bacterium]
MSNLGWESKARKYLLCVATCLAFSSVCVRSQAGEIEVPTIAQPRLSPSRGFFTNAFKLFLSCDTRDAIPWVSLDGSVPGPGLRGSFRYTSPIIVSNTSTVRARAYGAAGGMSRVATHSFIFPEKAIDQPWRPAGLPLRWNGVLADYRMDSRVLAKALPGYSLPEALLALPTLSIVLPREELFGETNGIYTYSPHKGPEWERAASMELIFADGSPGAQIDTGLAMHGYTSRHHSNTLKHSLRLKFRSRYGDSRFRFPLFGDTERQAFDSLVLRACSGDSFTAGSSPPRWEARRGSYLRDQWMRDTMRDLGELTSHGRYVHLWLSGLYWGVYDMCEAMDTTFAADYLGGKKKDYDILKDYFVNDGGDRAAWDAAAAVAREADPFQRLQGNNADGTRNPATPIYLNASNYVHYMMVQITSGSQDWPLNNWWSCRRRGIDSQGFTFCVWDQEEGNNSLTLTANVFCQPFAEPSEASCIPSPGDYHAAFFYDRLRRSSPAFRQFFMDQVWAAHTGKGSMTPEAN